MTAPVRRRGNCWRGGVWRRSGDPRVLPQVGAVICYRSIYMEAGKIHADAIRVPLFSAATFKPGGTVPVITTGDLHEPTSPDAADDLGIFVKFSDGYAARSPADPLLISDQRYAYDAEGLDAVWGIQLEQTDRPLFRITPRWNYIGKLARDLFCSTRVWGDFSGCGRVSASMAKFHVNRSEISLLWVIVGRLREVTSDFARG